MKKRVWVLCLICGMLLTLAACGNGSGPAGTPTGNVSLQGRINQEVIYFAENCDLEVGSQVPSVDFKVYGTNAYYPHEKSIVNYSVVGEEKTTDIYQWADAPGEWSLERVCYSEAGEVYALVTVGISATGASGNRTDAVHYFCKFDTERKLVFAQDLAKVYREAGENDFVRDSRLEVGSDGRVYISSPGALWIFDGDGSYKEEVSFGSVKDVQIKDFQSDASKNLYVLYEDNSTKEQFVAEIDTKEASVTAVQQTIGLTGISASEGSLLGFNGATVYTYDREEGALIELLTWSECDVDGSTVYSAKQLSDGRFLVSTNPSWGGMENYLVKSFLPNAGITSDSGKSIIRVALDGSPSDELKAFTLQFNKGSELYEVVLENYREHGYEEGLARLQSELEAGNGPDLIDMEFAMERGLVEYSYLEDLSMYLAESAEISEGDFLNFATEAYRIKGTLVAIPHRFTAYLTVGNAEVLGEKSGWTMEEYLDFLEGNAGTSVHAMFTTNAKLVCREILRLNAGYFMDMDACTCNFDNDIFRKLVEVLADYPLDYDYTQNFGEWRERLQSGEAVMETISVNDFMDLQASEMALGDNLNYVGLPTEEGVGVWAWVEDAFGISALAENKEGAWEFLEDLLQYRLQNPSTTSFTTYIPSLEVYAEWFMNLENSGRWKGYRIPDQEEINRYMALLEASQSGFNEFEMINDIIIPEMGEYYEGKQTMDELIESIEGQVELYLKERW